MQISGLRLTIRASSGTPKLLAGFELPPSNTFIIAHQIEKKESRVRYRPAIARVNVFFLQGEGFLLLSLLNHTSFNEAIIRLARSSTRQRFHLSPIKVCVYNCHRTACEETRTWMAVTLCCLLKVSRESNEHADI